MKPILVLKFGGTSVGSPEAIRRVAEIIASHQADAAVVVVSAAAGVTDLLDALSRAERGEKRGILEGIKRRHIFLSRALLSIDSFPEMDSVFDCIAQTAERNSEHDLGAKERALLLSCGERLSALLISRYLVGTGISAEFVDAKEIIITNDTILDADVDELSSGPLIRERILPLLSETSPRIPLVMGFVGRTPAGTPTVLGRGGSDYTATVLGAALRAKEVQIWTDVSGVYSDDPRKDPNAVFFPELSYEKAHGLALSGAKVIFPKCILTAHRGGIPIRVKNTFAPLDKGTLISAPHGDRPSSATSLFV